MKKTCKQRIMMMFGLILLSVFLAYNVSADITLDDETIIQVDNESYMFPESGITFDEIAFNESASWIRFNTTGFNVTSVNDIIFLISFINSSILDADDGDTVLTFSATTDSGLVWFNLSGFEDSTDYTLYVDEDVEDSYTTDGDGVLSFSYSSWSGHDFEIQKGGDILPCIALQSPENNSEVDTRGTDNFGISLTCGTPANVTLIVEQNNSGVWIELYNYTYNNQVVGFSADAGLETNNTGWEGRWHANATNLNGTSTTDYWYFTAFDDEILDEFPVYDSTEVSRPPANLSAYILGSDMTVSFYFVNMTPTVPVWTLITTVPAITNEYVEYTNLSSFGLGTEFYWGNTTYTWSINVTDGGSWANQTYTYTTIALISSEDARYEVSKDSNINVVDLNRCWSHRTVSGYAPYDGFYDVSDDGNVNVVDLNRIWSHNTI